MPRRPPREPDEDRADEPREALSEAERQALSDLCTDFFLLGLQIRAGQVELPACDTLRRRVLQLFESMKSQAIKAGVHPNDLDDVRYALAAFLDEFIQYSEWPHKSEWAARPLQAILFSESQAGKRFFERLQEVRRRSPPALEIYYTCLALGFMGEYKLANTQELDDLLDDLRRDVLGGALPKLIAAHGRRPEDARAGHRRLPLIPVAVGCLLLGVAGVALLYLVLILSNRDVLEMLKQLGRV